MTGTATPTVFIDNDKVEIRDAAGIELSEGTAKSRHCAKVVAPDRYLLMLP